MGSASSIAVAAAVSGVAALMVVVAAAAAQAGSQRDRELHTLRRQRESGARSEAMRWCQRQFVDGLDTLSLDRRLDIVRRLLGEAALPGSELVGSPLAAVDYLSEMMRIAQDRRSSAGLTLEPVEAALLAAARHAQCAPKLAFWLVEHAEVVHSLAGVGAAAVPAVELLTADPSAELFRTFVVWEAAASQSQRDLFEALAGSWTGDLGSLMATVDDLAAGGRRQ